MTAVPSALGAKELIRGLYLSAFAAHQEWLLTRIEEAGDAGDLNAVVVDMKDDFGLLRYPSQNSIARGRNAIRPIFDADSLIARMHRHGVRVIARMVCFKDDYACNYSDFGVMRSGGGLWADAGGAHWLNAFNERTWYYLIDIAQELEEVGFDEIQLDYVRFPTDGDVLNCVFYGRRGRIKEEAIAEFLKMMQDSISVPLSVDVFGYAAWRTLKLEGQELARIGPNVSYICPMLYPSHFSPDFLRGWPMREFWVYFKSVLSARKLLGENETGIVTYIQGFSWRAPGYGPDYIHHQIAGSLAAGADGFFIWNASGNYGPALTAMSWGGNQLREKVAVNPPDIHTRSIQRVSQYELPEMPRIRIRYLYLLLPSLQGGSRSGSRPER